MAEGKTATKTIQSFSKGDSTRTARHADVMNELVDAINAIRSLRVTPDDFGRFIFADANSVLELNKKSLLPTPPSPGTYVLGAIDGSITWLATQQCGCSSFDGGSA